MSEPARLLIAHDHHLFRQCLTSVLAEHPDLLVRDTAADGQLAERVREYAADLVLLDLHAPGRNTVDLTRELSRQFPEVKIVLLGLPETRETFLECVEAGAQGFVAKDGSLDDLTRTVRAALRDEVICPPPLTFSLFEKLAGLSREVRRGSLPEACPLSFRQLEIVQLIADGLGNKQIARQLRLSLYTVKNHIHNILSVLSVEDRREAVECARRHRWVGPGKK